MNYHSALKKELLIDQELDFFKNEGNLVFRHDICIGLPSYFSRCDIFYSEPAWLDGYIKFLDRAAKERSTYYNYLKAISDIIKNTEKACWLIIGNHAIKYLPIYQQNYTVKLHGYKTNLLGWNNQNKYSFSNLNDFLIKLSYQYNCIGDFCCGYGNTGRIFQQQGKKFVMSDINGKCVYFIAKELMGYESSIP